MPGTREWRAFDLGALPYFSRQQVAAWNALRRVFAGGEDWQTWIAEGVADLFESPAGIEIRLRQSHTMDAQRPEAVFTSQDELVLGRDETCGVRLAPRSVGNRHARIFTREGRCYIQDLGSALGTFLNETRLAANQPAAIATGDQFAIFPYSFAVEVTERWVRGASVAVHYGPVAPLNGHGLGTPLDQIVLALQIQPMGAVFRLEAARPFLERLSAQLLAPLGLGAAGRLGLTTADTGFLELLVAVVLERANRDLPFPLHMALASTAILPEDEDEEGALSFSFAVQLAELTGAFRLIMTESATDLLARSDVPQIRAAVPEVSWAFPLSAGHVDLTAAEIALIEPSDVVLLTRKSAILFPNAPERGWRLLPERDNLWPAAIDKYFERDCVTESNNELDGGTISALAPDLASLPVRLHAIIGEKEMTLAEANLLVAGAIVELDQAKSAPVRIALNGKVAGTGELVEVDGRLGVRIQAWRAP